MKTFLLASVTLLAALALSISAQPSATAAQEDLPNTFFFTHYELLGDRTTRRRQVSLHWQTLRQSAGWFQGHPLR